MSVPPQELPELPVYPLRDAPELEEAEPFSKDYQTGVPIGIDFGASQIRIGLTSSTKASHSFPTLLARYRERKSNKAHTFIGNDVYLDQAIKSQARSPYDGPLITNWDYVEQMLDYSFNHLGVNSTGGVDNPIILTEKPASPLLQRKGFYELLYETYNVNKVTVGIDSLFSYYYNNGKNGLVIGTGHEATHLIPVIDGKGIIEETKRINWGGHPSSNYLNSLLQLKYPYFPTKINSFQIDNLVKDYCYISKDYQEELGSILNLENLEKKDVTVEAPFIEVIQPKKTKEELERQAEKRRENGRRLQQQAQQKRLEKLIEKEKEFDYYTNLKNRLATLNKKLSHSTLREEGFSSEEDFNNTLKGLENALKRARKQDIGDDDSNSNTPPSFPLVDKPDEELNDEEIKEKRKQRLLKANYEARQRAKKEKEEEKIRLEEEAKADEQFRKTNLSEWIRVRREELKQIVQKKKDRAKLKEQLNDRKSHAAQVRMKNITSLAAEDTRGMSKRRRAGATIDNDPNDTFGSNDDDWAIYRDIVNVDDEEMIEEEDMRLVKIEKELLEFDENFTIEDTLDSQFDWKKSTIHLFLRGPRPFDSQNVHQQHQMHLNVERIRVPEVLFQPSIAGLDQCGITELSETLLLNTLRKRDNSSTGFSGDSDTTLTKDIFLTGGQSLFKNFEERIYSEFRQFLPFNSPLKIRTASDPIMDPWNGIAKWSKTKECEDSYLTKQEYEEMGSDYIKEHNLGNVSYR